MEVNGHNTTICPSVNFTAPDLSTIYALCIARFEDLDIELRSLPTPQRGKQAAEEKVRVESVIRQICNADVALVIDGVAVE